MKIPVHFLRFTWELSCVFIQSSTNFPYALPPPPQGNKKHPKSPFQTDFFFGGKGRSRQLGLNADNKKRRKKEEEDLYILWGNGVTTLKRKKGGRRENRGGEDFKFF